MKLAHFSSRFVLATLVSVLTSCAGDEPDSSASDDPQDETQTGTSSGGAEAGSGGDTQSMPGDGGAGSGGEDGAASAGGSTPVSTGGTVTASGGEAATGAGLGEECEESDDCQTGVCEDGVCLTTAPGCEVADVEKSPGSNWSDSYSVDGKCYCATTFDHAIGDIVVETPVGERTVQQVCDAIGPGPGIEGNPVYNDIQCGNGPANDAGDEDYCPGRVDKSDAGCCTIGPTWDLSVLNP